ncbi:MAG TPA: hypothetical protein VME20_04860 [Acidimicrobiales bacterium]|nr:hypothetical protein [Acidimicrobiales bacterium]
MTVVHVLSATSSSAPLDWVLGAAASVVFVALVAIPAAALNARDRKRREQASGPN